MSFKSDVNLLNPTNVYITRLFHASKKESLVKRCLEKKP